MPLQKYGLPSPVSSWLSRVTLRGAKRETWKLNNGKEIIDLDDAHYISQKNAEELKMQTLEPKAIMKMAKQTDYYGEKGKICMLYKNKIYYSSVIIDINPPLVEDFEPEYDISQDFEDFNKKP